MTRVVDLEERVKRFKWQWMGKNKQPQKWTKKVLESYPRNFKGVKKKTTRKMSRRN